MEIKPQKEHLGKDVHIFLVGLLHLGKAAKCCIYSTNSFFILRCKTS